MSEIELLSIGDASLDVFINPSESEALCQTDDKECLICFSYGEKIPVKEFEISIGGNAANNSIGTRRLGVNSAVVLTLGADDIGNQIKTKLDQEGVNTTFVIQQPAGMSNYSTVISYQGERTIFTYKAPRSYEFPVKLPQVPWVYLTSMGDSFMPFYNHLLDFLRVNPQIRLAFNPGSRQLRAGVDAIRDMIARSYTIFVNREEAEGLVGMGDSHGKDRELLMGLNKLGVRLPVVTDGGNGSMLYDGRGFFKVGILPVDAYERTGAGDAFGSGFMSAVIKGRTLTEALLWGTVNSASVIGYTGSQKGLLRQEDLAIWMERAKSSGIKVEPF